VGELERLVAAIQASEDELDAFDYTGADFAGCCKDAGFRDIEISRWPGLQARESRTSDIVRPRGDGIEAFRGPSRMQQTTTSRDGVEIAYATYGMPDRDAVALVHGWSGNRSYWTDQIDFLAERYCVIAVDLGGHGESGLGRDDWNLAAFGDDVVAVIEDVGAQKVALVGHSMGGDAVVHAAQRLGDRVVGLVWVDAFRSLGDESPSPPDEVEAFLAPFREDFGRAVERFVRGMVAETADRGLVDRIAADMAAAPPEVALGCLRYARNRQPPILAALPHIAAPIVAINPDIGPTDVDSMRRHGVEPIVLEGVGHFLMIEDPDRFNPVLAATLASFGNQIVSDTEAQTPQ
jgi:pimeloyl-ACP methyl ester carboxylesterase